MQRPFGVGADDLAHARLAHDLGDRDPRRAEADHQHSQVLQAPFGELDGVQQRRHHHHRGAVLVVVKDGDVELPLQALLDLEAARRGDVLEVDPPEARRHQLHGAHDLVGVLGVEADREGVDARELLEQARLALHHRHRRRRADVAQAEHRRAVGDDRHGVALDRVLRRLVGVVADRDAHARHARRVHHREIVARLQRVLVVLFDLAAHVQQEGAVGRVDHLHAGDRLDRLEDPAPVFAVGRVHHDVSDAGARVGLDQIDSRHHAAGLADRARDLPHRAGGVSSSRTRIVSRYCALGVMLTRK